MTNNVLYVSDGGYGNRGGYLAPVVQGQYGQVIQIDVRDLSDTTKNLTGYTTITGTISNRAGVVASVSGTLALSGTPSVAPNMTWALDVSDPGTAGIYTVVFSLSNGSTVLKTLPVGWIVLPDPAVNATFPDPLVGVSTSQKALLASIAALTGLVEMAAGSATGIAIQTFMRTFLSSANVIAARLNLLPSYTGNTGKVLAVNGAETDVEWVAQGGGGAVDSVFGRTGAVVAASGDYAASEITDDSIVGQLNVKDALDVLQNTINGANATIDAHTEATTTVHGIADTSLLLDTGDLGVTVQSYSAKTAAIAALTWAANSIILLTGTATASVQALASHVVTFLQSASAADARSAIGAGTGDVTGPGSSTDNTIARFDLTTGKIIQGGTNAPTYDDSGNVIVVAGNSYYLGAGANARVYLSGGNVIIDALNQKLLLTAGNIEHGTTANVLDIGREGGREIKATVAAGYRFTQRYTLSSGTAQAVIANGTYDVAGVCRVEYALSATGVKKTGAIDDLQPSGSSNLYDDGGTNTVVVAVAADGSLSIQRTAGSLTYTIVLSILFV